MRSQKPLMTYVLFILIAIGVLTQISAGYRVLLIGAGQAGVLVARRKRRCSLRWVHEPSRYGDGEFAVTSEWRPPKWSPSDPEPADAFGGRRANPQSPKWPGRRQGGTHHPVAFPDQARLPPAS